MQEKVCLASDNFTQAHPAIVEAIVQANEGYAPSYGADPWTQEAERLIAEAFQSHPKAFMLPTGTGANVLAIKIACKRYQSVLCTDIAHLHYQECGAAESLVGCKLLTVPHQQGKATPEALLKKLKTERAFGKHSTFPGVLSITQPTEVGTVYTLEELRQLAHFCKAENLLFHMDGSRLYNAAVALGVSLYEIVNAASLDILYLGGTKNGLMCAEALLIFNPVLEEGSDHLHKQTLGLLSKMRYLSAQYIPFFKEGLWRTLATEANQKAQEIASLIQKVPDFSLSYPVETNQIFFTVPDSWVSQVQEKVQCYLWNQEKKEIRFVTSWCTTDLDLQMLKQLLC